MLRQATYYDQRYLWKNLYSSSQKGQCFENLISLITTDDNLMLAYRMIKDNKGSKTPGVDGVTIARVKKMGLAKFLELLKTKFENYAPTAVRRKYIPKSNGKRRPLGIPALVDRIVQQAIKQVLEPILEAKFYDHSYGFRPGRSQEQAVAACNFLIMRGYTYSVNIDIDSFFDNIDHSTMLKILWLNGIRDRKLLSIIKAILKAPIQGEGIPRKGTPQGGVLSPLLANAYLNELDQWIDGQWRKFPLGNSKKYNTRLKRAVIVRFADDFQIFVKTRSEAVRWFHAVQSWLRERLRLECSAEKSGIVNLKKNATKFLGFEIKAVKSRNNGHVCAKCSISKKKKKGIGSRIKREWKALAKSFPAQKRRWSYCAARLEAYIRSTRHYNRICHTVYKDLAEVDYRTHRARDKILRKHPRLKPLLSKIYLRACHDPQDMQETSNLGKSSLGLCKNIKFKIPQRKVAVNPYSENLKIDAFQAGLNGLRAKVKAWGGAYVEKADICLSLYTQQRGKDPLTGTSLDIDRVECHRKTPGAEYVFRNCILLDRLSHQVVHGTWATVSNFIRILELNKNRREKLLRLWRMAHSI